MKLLFSFVLIAFLSCPHLVEGQADALTQDLSGAWDFQLDPEDLGEKEAWFQDKLADSIRLPGSLQEQGYGNPASIHTKWLARTGVRRKNYPDYFTHPMYRRYREEKTFRFPYWLQPERHYVGPAWYQRTVDIPASWEGRRMVLFLERCHWESRVWIDNEPAGSNDSLGTPHVYDLTPFLRPGRHTLTLRIDNRMIQDVGINAHSISDQTQSAWNGIIGRMEMQCLPPVFVEDAQVFPDVEQRRARVVVSIGSITNASGAGELTASVALHGKTVLTKSTGAAWTGGRGRQEVTLDLGDQAVLWDEFNPQIYTLSLSLKGSGASSEYRTSFGLREVKADGTRFRVNNRPIFLRGTLECCIFPLTGYPPMDERSWLKVMRKAKDYGLNHLRFHSWCPPEAAFRAADREGIYLQPEVSMWASIKSADQYNWAVRESRRMLETYGNHPSFLMMALGNEMRVAPRQMTAMLKTWKQDPRRVYTGACNRDRQGPVDGYDFLVSRMWEEQGTDSRIRYQMGWPPLPQNSYFTSRAPQTSIDWREGISAAKLPLLSHEIVQRCSYPDPAWQSKYTGSFRAAYLDIARDQLAERGMLDMAPELVEQSGRWQVQQFKEELEAALRTPGMAGFQMLSLHDFPGQGAALVGVLDAFWDEKGYVTGREFRRFCSPTVPLARMEKRTWVSDEVFKAGVEVTHYGAEPMPDADINIRILGPDEKVMFTRRFNRRIPLGGALPLEDVRVPLATFPAPASYKLAVKVGTAENDWDFWVYPATPPSGQQGDVLIVQRLDDAAMNKLEEGGKVLWLPSRPEIRGDIPQCFSSIYWNAPYTDGGESHTMGMLCDPAHPLFTYFPTGPTVDWNWYELLVSARPMVLDEWKMKHAWPKTYRPVIQPIDDWYQNRKLALLAEARVAAGTLVVCSMDLASDLDSRVVARQFRYALLRYMNSEAFNPEVRIRPDQLQALVKED